MRKILAFIVVLFVGLIISPLTVSAHTSKPTLMIPAENANIESMPLELILEFTEDLIQPGAAVSILDPSGAQLVNGIPKVSAKSLSARVNPSDYKGEYRVTYKVTSADGAVNQGTYRVYVTGGIDFKESGMTADTLKDNSFDEVYSTEFGNQESETRSASVLSFFLLIAGGASVLAGSVLYFRNK